MNKWMYEWFDSPFKTTLQSRMFSPKKWPPSFSRSHALLGTLRWHRLTQEAVPPAPSSSLTSTQAKPPVLSLTGTFSEGGNEQRPHGLIVPHVLFTQLICNPRGNCSYITQRLGTETVAFPSHLRVTWSPATAWTWPKARTGIKGGDFCELTGRGGRRIRG